MRIEHRQAGDVVIVDVHGDVDVATAPQLREKLVQLIGDGHTDLVVDLNDVDFLDSTGLGVLVGGLKRARSNKGSLQVVSNNERVKKVFAITGLTEVFGLTDQLGDEVSP